MDPQQRRVYWKQTDAFKLIASVKIGALMTKRRAIIEKATMQGISNLLSPRLLTLRKAAEYLGLTEWGMRERIWAGHIPVVQFPGGRKQYVDVRDLEGFIDTHKRVIE